MTQLDLVNTLTRKLTATKKQKATLARVDRLIDWFSANRPSVRNITLSVTDYDSLLKDLPPGVFVVGGGLAYRGFLLKR